MSLSSDSNTINALGIFGRLTLELEEKFSKLEQKYSQRPENNPANEIFSHLSLVISNDVITGEIPKYLDLLRELNSHLPFRLKTNGVIIKEKKHLGLTFDTAQTQEIRDLASRYIPDGVVTTFYTKVVWFVRLENQEQVRKELEQLKEMIFGDFYLVANQQNKEHTIYKASSF